MISPRTLSLTLGPVAIVAASYWLALADRSSVAARQAPLYNDAAQQTSEQREKPTPEITGGRTPGRLDGGERLASRPGPRRSLPPDNPKLHHACHQQAAALLPRLMANCQILVRTPYVLAGDLASRELERLYHDTILPTSRALSITYFDRQPDEPILMLMFANETSYRQHAEQLDQQSNAGYFGYYIESQRRIVLDVSTGSGTIAHELTHALADFDFPEMPEWFDEGLASVHEQSNFSEDGLRLLGLTNWRIHPLRDAMRNDRLPTLTTLISRKTVRDQHQPVDYAQARYFCLYLQHRQLLAPFYRKFRENVARDPLGLQTLKHLLNVDSLAPIETQFRQWLQTLP